eukprot:2520112-Pyramimonas_sp.AAC.1
MKLYLRQKIWRQARCSRTSWSKRLVSHSGVGCWCVRWVASVQYGPEGLAWRMPSVHRVRLANQKREGNGGVW